MNFSSDRRPTAGLAGVAVSLACSSDRARAERIAAILSGCPVDEAPVEVDVGGDDGATFAVELAERIASDYEDGLGGNIVVALEPRADLVEIALVLERSRPGLDRGALEARLAECLLTGEELAAGPEAWAHYPDPFPEWVVEHHH